MMLPSFSLIIESVIQDKGLNQEGISGGSFRSLGGQGRARPIQW
jgi:hypothetical protein